jgi:predicted AAA+ superfamily ATPase
LFRDYLISSGVKEEQINFRQQEETHIMENIIYNELIIRGYSVDVGVVEIIENVEGKKEENSVRLILL